MAALLPSAPPLALASVNATKGIGRGSVTTNNSAKEARIPRQIKTTKIRVSQCYTWFLFRRRRVLRRGRGGSLSGLRPSLLAFGLRPRHSTHSIYGSRTRTQHRVTAAWQPPLAEKIKNFPRSHRNPFKANTQGTETSWRQNPDHFGSFSLNFSHLRAKPARRFAHKPRGKEAGRQRRESVPPPLLNGTE